MQHRGYCQLADLVSSYLSRCFYVSDAQLGLLPPFLHGPSRAARTLTTTRMRTKETISRRDWTDSVAQRRPAQSSSGLPLVRHSLVSCRFLRADRHDLVFWVCSFVLIVMDWRNGKANRPRDPPFTHPTDASEHVSQEDEESLYTRPQQAPSRHSTYDEEATSPLQRLAPLLWRPERQRRPILHFTRPLCSTTATFDRRVRRVLRSRSQWFWDVCSVAAPAQLRTPVEPPCGITPGEQDDAVCGPVRRRPCDCRCERSEPAAPCVRRLPLMWDC